MKFFTIIILLIQTTISIDDQRVITTLKYSKYRVVPLVVNGTEATVGQVPFLVSIKESKKPPHSAPGLRLWINLCGGSIISENKVLTAAHCFEVNNFHYYNHFGLLRVVAGSLKTNILHSGITETSRDSQWRRIINLKLHHMFFFPHNDIALVVVDENFIFCSAVNAIPTAQVMSDYNPKCYSAGYGNTAVKRYKIPDKLLIAPIVPMTRMKCSFIWQMNMNKFICTHSVIADVGQGDSGGPLACSGTLDRSEQMGKDLLVGIVSGKNYDKTTLYTRVAAFSDWVKRGSGYRSESSNYLFLITFLIVIYVLFHCFIYPV